MPKRKPDISFENHGSVALIRPLSKRGRTWCDANIAVESWQWFGGAIAAEPRVVQDVIDGAEADGLRTMIA